MSIINLLFGEGQNLNTLQMCCRTLVIFLVTLLYIRLAGKRIFGNISAFDNIVTITLGALLSRAIVGASPFLPVVLSSLLLILLQRLIAWITLDKLRLGKIIKGTADTLFKNGDFDRKGMRSNLVSKNEIMEEVRKEIHEKMLDNVDEVILERNGEMSVIRKKAG